MTATNDTRSSSDDDAHRSGTAAAPCLFLLFECEAPGRPPSRHSLADLDELLLGRGGERQARRRVVDGRRRLELRVADRRVSAEHALVTRDREEWVIRDAGAKNGVLVNGIRVERHCLVDGDLVEAGRTFLRWRAAVPLATDDPPDLTADDLRPAVPAFATLVPELARSFARLARVAPTDLPVLVRGETGTGKEIVARAVHELSRRAGDLVAVNCGAVPETLVEAELFGSRRGAYSGAVEDRPGLVRAADRGTLFLDEIGDLPLASQAALLRVLQEREVVAVGAARPVRVDFRLVAATHRDLPTMVAEGRFRDDLFARLGGFAIDLPPLRERREDLGLLVPTLLQRGAPERAASLRLSPEVARALLAYRWPFNLRELERCLAAAAALSDDGVIRTGHLPPDLLATAPPPAGASRPLRPEDVRLRDELVALLQEHRGSISAAARAMGRQRVQIHRWLRRFAVDPDLFRR